MKVTHKSLRTSLDQTLLRNQAFETEKGDRIRTQVMNTLRKEFQHWCPEGQLLPIGSYRLGIHSPDSDIDLLCLSPADYSRESFQEVFFAQLSLVPDVSYCYGIFSAKVPIIKLIYQGVKVDLQFASTSQDLKAINTAELEEATLLGINAYRNTEYILGVIPNLENFKVLARTVRLWARQRNLYSGLSGCLGGISWTILSAKICLMYPSLNSIELIQQFFKVFSLWDWTVPVSLTPSPSPSLPYAGREVLMNILTPIHPCYNSAYTLISSNFSCIVEELELASRIVKDVIEGNHKWDALFEELDFFQSYRYFIRVSINAVGESEYETWSGLIFSRLKYFLQELERIYPGPVVGLYNRPFEGHCQQFQCCKNFFVGLKFNFPQGVKFDLRSPIYKFCSVLTEIRPSKSCMCLRVGFVPRKELVNMCGVQGVKS